jgi:hypothetical protein
MISKLLKTGAALVLLPALAMAQGSNSCGSATAIAGEGLFPYDNNGATTDGPSNCASMGSDVWFAWTATSTDTFTVDTCNGTGYDSALNVYPSGCPASGSLGCNDDSCGLQSSVSFAGVNGTTYLFQVGGYSGAQGSGNLEVTSGGPTGGCATQAPGPDVIVGSLNGISNWGGVGTKSAYSIGTTSCNYGDTGLEWISNQNRHPVIGQNIYRLKDGKFEQIGQGWLKHGFLALAQNLCCTCLNPGNGAILGVGCSDPYGSSLNGSQSGLGPRSEVNADTGFYVYPFTHGNQGSTGDATYKRIQVETSDLNPALNAGASYYGDGQYIAHDDAAAGNGNNNVSWININVGGTSGGYYNLSLSGSTVREEAAIHAWSDADAGVVLTNAQVPGEGLFVVGSRAYDNGNGTYDYEYAVYNMNSDLSCGSVSVPTQAGTSVTSIGFHDVDYHSGEPYSGADWVGSAGASSVDWATSTFGANPNANAIRWGTLYNVRFTANAAPVSGNITLGLFKNGGSISVAAEVPGTPSGGPTPPANDTCFTPTAIGGTGTYPYDSTDATSTGFNGGGGCNTNVNQDVFLQWTAPADGDYTFDTCSTGYNTRLSLHDGVGCGASCIGSSNNSCGNQESIDVNGLLAGDMILVQVGGTTSNEGPGTLTVSVQAVPPPANDLCSGATAINGEGAFNYDTSNATSSGFNGVGGCAPPNQDVFLQWTCNDAGDYTFDTCLSGYDTKMSLHNGVGCAATCNTSNDDACGLQSSAQVFGLNVGDQILVQLGGDAAAEGAATLTVTKNVIPPPANDTCASGTAIAGTGSFAYDTTNATTTGFNGGGPCSSAIGGDVYFVWTANSAGDFQFDTCGSSYDTRIALHDGADCSATCLADNDDNAGVCGGGSLQSSVTLVGLGVGDTVLVQVGGFGANVGPATLNVTDATPPPPAPANNDCSTPDSLNGEGTTAWNNDFATTSGFDGGNPLICMSPSNPDQGVTGQIGSDLFWAFTAPCDGDWTFDTVGTPVGIGGIDTRINVHLGGDCSATCLASNDDISAFNFLSSVTITAIEGGTYLVQTGSWTPTAATGDGFLNVSRAGGACPTFDLTIACDPASNHMGGTYAKLDNSSFGSGVGSGLHLAGHDGPALQWGFFLVSAGGSGNLPVNSGVLCLDSPTARYNVQAATNQGLPALNSICRFDASGNLENFAGTGVSGGNYGFDVPVALPFSPAGQSIQSGETWYFQLWFRDHIVTPGDSSNFTNMVCATFP